MASYQKIALYILFDLMERDLIDAIRRYSGGEPRLTDDETSKAERNLRSRSHSRLDPKDPFDQLYGLDLGEKYAVLLRHKSKMDESSRSYYTELNNKLGEVIGTRNSVMHGRPLTVNEYSIGFAFAQNLLSNDRRWPLIAKSYYQYSKSPESLVSKGLWAFLMKKFKTAYSIISYARLR